MLLSLPALLKFNDLMMLSAKVDKNSSLHYHIPVLSDLYRITELKFYVNNILHLPSQSGNDELLFQEKINVESVKHF
jgi:hypothetical protein